MMRLALAAEPPSFTRKVREPGENALAALPGRRPPHPRLGRPIALTKRVAGKPVRKTIEDFPYWQDCLDELYDAYGGICAYYCFRIERATLLQVDHFVAKTGNAGQAYEWTSYRLACGYANICKNEYPDVLDPAQIEDGWFQLDLATLGVDADDSLPADQRKAVETTIVRLKLREGRALEVRQRAMEHFRRRRVNFAFLEMDHPFLARELARQGVRDAAQLPPLSEVVFNTVEPELIEPEP